MKKVEEKYKELSEKEHILHRPNMWIGSIKYEDTQQFIYDVNEAKMKVADVSYIPAMLKLVDEVISNSCDEFRRKENLGLNKIHIIINSNGYITVKDNGKGMTEVTQSHIFEPFYSEKEQHSGLGLPLSQSIIHNHNGKLTCQSEPEVGTTIQILLPSP